MNKPERLWMAEFPPEYAPPPEIEERLENGMLEDCSWHNDVCPSFCISSSSSKVRLFAHPANPADREDHGLRRYAVGEGEDWLETDDILVALARLREIVK